MFCILFLLGFIHKSSKLTDISKYLRFHFVFLFNRKSKIIYARNESNCMTFKDEPWNTSQSYRSFQNGLKPLNNAKCFDIISITKWNAFAFAFTCDWAELILKGILVAHFSDICHRLSNSMTYHSNENASIEITQNWNAFVGWKYKKYDCFQKLASNNIIIRASLSSQDNMTRVCFWHQQRYYLYIDTWANANVFVWQRSCNACCETALLWEWERHT